MELVYSWGFYFVSLQFNSFLECIFDLTSDRAHDRNLLDLDGVLFLRKDVTCLGFFHLQVANQLGRYNHLSPMPLFIYWHSTDSMLEVMDFNKI